MPFTPLYILALIVLGVIACVVSAVVITALRGGDLGISGFALIAITVFATSLLGPLLTNFSSPTPATWWWALAARVGWQLGGGMLVALATLDMARKSAALGKRSVWVLAACLLLFGGVLCVNPLLDLAQGPLVLRGSAGLDVERTHGRRASIWAQLHLVGPDGKEHEIDMAGWGASEAERELRGCDGHTTVQVTVLRHVQRVLDARCE
jgi:hypothetical protein